MAEYLELTFGQVAMAAGLILVNGIISIYLRLNLELSLLVASLRTIIQLLLIGLVLKWVFGQENVSVVLLLAFVMTIIAGMTAAGRNQKKFPGLYWNTIVSVWASSWIVTSFALFVVLNGTERWYTPQYAIPLLGMVLGNTLNGISLGLNTLTDNLVLNRTQVDSLLAIGATRWEAVRTPVRQALRTGMLPIINSMMVVGIVSLPGMMTGQLVSGMDPMQAVKYQIVIMFLIASATGLGTIGVVLLSIYRLFNENHQFCYAKIR